MWEMRRCLYSRWATNVHQEIGKHRQRMEGTLFPELTYSPPGRGTAREMAEVATPICRATSASESSSGVTDSFGCVMGDPAK
jgi:hypothetical protein